MAFQFAPYQIPPHDGTEDITDLWIEETDPENVKGECCDAFYLDEEWRQGFHCELVALRITGGMSSDLWSVNLPRDMAIRQLGAETIARLENERVARLYTQAP